MFSILRKLRRTFLETGVLGKYGIYAIGEISLVVVGILIALQINQWNEERQNKAFERRMFVEVKKALENELVRFDRVITRMQLLDSTVHVFLPLAKQKALIPESYKAQIKRLNIGISFEYNPGPYSSIKNHGLDKISNDSLRTMLVHFYDYQYPRFEQQIVRTDRSYDNHRDQMRNFGVKQSIVPETGEFYYQEDIPDDILQSEGFVEFLYAISERANMTLYRVYGFRPIVESMIQLMENELED